MLPQESTLSKVIRPIVVLAAVAVVTLIGLGILLLVVVKQGRGLGS